MKIQELCCFIILIFTLAACKPSVEDLQPKSKFETGTGDLPLYSFEVVPGSATLIRLDSIAEGGNFTVRFTALSHGSIQALGNAFEISLDTGNWHKDSTNYTITKSTVERSGWIFFTNKNFVADTIIEEPEPVDTLCSALPDRWVYFSFNVNALVGSLFPDTFSGRVDSVAAIIYTASISPAGNRIQYLANPALQEQNWAFDTVFYKLKARNRKCFTGKLIVTLGDTCEPLARADFLNAPNGRLLFPETLLTENDKGCNNLLGNYITRTAEEFNYGNYKVMETAHGVLVDTLVSGNQHYKYTRSNPNAGSDGFYYYFKNNSTGRTTKAWVTLTF